MNYIRSAVQIAKGFLEIDGYVTDEQVGLGTHPFEQDLELLKEDLREVGFESELSNGAYNRFGGSGSTFYWICLAGEEENAEKLSEKWALENPD